MRALRIATLAAFSLLATFAASGGTAQAQSIDYSVKNIALKSGESTELGQVFFITGNCKSILKETPQVEILDGPPGVTAAITSAKVVPRGYSCANPISGGKLIITAKDIQEHSHTRMVLRVNYKTFSGDRQRSENINITLFPPN
jgi:hypothetical protein